MERTFFNPGEPILLREIHRGRVWAARPVRVVEDGLDRTVVYLAPGTRWKRPVGPNGQLLRIPSDSWSLGDAEWIGNATLRIMPAGRAHSILVWWGVPAWEFGGWYVNLEEAMRRTPLGFDYLDQILDIVIAPDRSSSAWKDEDELEVAQNRGLFIGEQAAAIRAEGEGVLAELAAGAIPFSEDWPSWRPDPSWAPVELPEGWDRIPSIP